MLLRNRPGLRNMLFLAREKHEYLHPASLFNSELEQTL